MKKNILILCITIIIAAGYIAVACGGDGPCTRLCQELRPKLIDQMPDVSEEDVKCDEPPWTEKTNCSDCLQILQDLYDATATDPDPLCLKHFGTKY